MKNSNEKNAIKVRDLLIYFGISAALSAAVKKILQREEYNVLFNALAMTLGWIIGKMITNYIDEMRETSDEN